MRDKEKKKETERRIRENNKERYNRYAKEFYKENKEKCRKARNEYAKKNKEKFKMWNKVNYQLKKEGIKLAECSICHSKENLIKHHEDYSKPFDIIVLCKSCHGKLHSFL